MNVIKVILSFLILLHCWLMFSLPFNSPILEKSLPKVFYTYASLSGANRSWLAFSQNPKLSNHFEVEKFFKNDNSEFEGQVTNWPLDESVFNNLKYFSRMQIAKNLFEREEYWYLIAKSICDKDQNISSLNLRLKKRELSELGVHPVKSFSTLVDESQFDCGEF